MKPLTFKTAIQTIFEKVDLKDLTLTARPKQALKVDLTIENVASVLSRIQQNKEEIVEEIKTERILLNALRHHRRFFFEVEHQLGMLETKETLEAIDLENNIDWHEKSKFVRLFLVSKKGEQLEEEKKEADLAKNLSKQFSEELTDFELMIDRYILEVGIVSDLIFGLLVEEWRALGNLKDNLELARQNLKSGYNKLGSKTTCWSCWSSVSIDNGISKKHFSLANEQLKQQINLLIPVYDGLTEKVELKIAQVREKLFL